MTMIINNNRTFAFEWSVIKYLGSSLRAYSPRPLGCIVVHTHQFIRYAWRTSNSSQHHNTKQPSKMKYPVLCIFLVAVSRVRPHFTLPVKSLSDQENAISGNMHRQRRTGLSFYTTGVVKTGLRALNNLLKDTRELPVVDMTYRDFVKDGGFDRALLDFQAVTKQYADSKFAKFKSMSEFMSTEVGDRFIVLRRRGENGRPEIEVMRFKDDRSMGRQFSGERIDRITYTN